MEPRTAEKFVAALKELDVEMKKDIKAGHQWRYTNAKKRNKTFAAARKQKNYVTNCATGVDWGLTLAGVPSSAQAWYGSDGSIAWVGQNAEKNAKKYFEIIKIPTNASKNRTVKGLYDSGQLCEGDILVYHGMNHTNAYIGGGKSFDSGHAYCTGSGEMAPFKKWVGSLAHKSAKVAYILRLKDRIRYRIQVGAYTTDKGLQNRTRQLDKLKIDWTVKSEDGYKKLQLKHVFSSKEQAEKYIAALRDKHKIVGILKEE